MRSAVSLLLRQEEVVESTAVAEAAWLQLFAPLLLTHGPLV